MTSSKLCFFGSIYSLADNDTDISKTHLNKIDQIIKVDFYLHLQNTGNFALKASSVVLVLINNKCNWKAGEQQPTYFDHNTKG